MRVYKLIAKTSALIVCVNCANASPGFAAPKTTQTVTTTITSWTQFVDLEQKILSGPADQLSQLEHLVARRLQKNPDSVHDHYAMSFVLLRMFMQEPSDTSFLQQSANMAAQAYELDPKSELGVVALAHILEVTGEQEKGLSLLREAERKGIVLGWRGHFVRAKLMSADQDADAVLKELRIAMETPDVNRNIVAPFIVATIGSIQNDQTQFKEIQSWALHFPCEDLMLASAQQYLKLRKGSEAALAYKEILKLSPRNAEATFGLAMTYLHLHRDYKLAAETFQKVLAVDTHHVFSVEARMGLALAQIRLPKSKDALPSALVALKGAANPELALIRFTDELTKQKRFQDALSLVSEMAEQVPGVALSYALRGEFLTTHFKQNEDAIRAFTDAIVIDDSKSAYYNGRGLAHLGLKRTEKALADFETATRIDPSDASARYNFACALALSGRKKDALQMLAGALNQDERLAVQARQDRDFANLHGMPEFERVLDREQRDLLAH